MVLVFYIVISIILTILNLAFLISISELELDIKNLQMSNINKKRNNEKIQIKVSLKIGNFHWLGIKITKTKLAAIYAKMNEKQYKKNITNKDLQRQAIEDVKVFLKDKDIRHQFKETKIKIEKLDTRIFVSTKNYIATSYLVAIISIIISNILPHVVDKKVNLEQDIFYQIKPIYNPINMYSVQANIRISTKIIKVLKDIYGMKKTKEKLKIDVQPV